ncbi:meiotic nuclear division protein 1 homolog [Styela clava]
MSKKRGLSYEEKRKRMLDIFFEKKEFFHIKEMEKIAPKLKGITPMSVKEVLQSLVDDDMVETEKVGTSSFYWAFPSKAVNVRKRKLQHLQSTYNEQEKELASTKDEVAKAKKSRTESNERERLLSELTTLQADKDSLTEELARLKDCDPETIKQMQEEIGIAKDAANRWTDNIFSLKTWIKRKFPIDENIINKQFDIPEDLDYIT